MGLDHTILVVISTDWEGSRGIKRENFINKFRICPLTVICEDLYFGFVFCFYD